jgi:hypothetical protein
MSRASNLKRLCKFYTHEWRSKVIDEKQLWEEYDKWFFGKGISDYGTKMFGFMAAKWALREAGLTDSKLIAELFAKRIADLESDVVRLHKDKMDLWEKAHGYAPAVEKEAAIPPIFYNGETKRDPALKARIDEHIAMSMRTASGPELQAALVSPTVGDSAGEPVAWMYEYATTLNGDVYGGWTKDTSTCSPDIHERAIRNLSPLYAHPPAQTADVRAMTDERIREIFWKVQDQKGDYMQFARALLEQTS